MTLKSLFLSVLLTFCWQIHSKAQVRLIDHILIVNGSIGQSSDSKKYQEGIDFIKKSIHKNYQIQSVDVVGNYSEWERAIQQLKAESSKSFLLVFYGHSNSTPNDIHFHFEGKDLKISEAGKFLKEAGVNAGIIWSSECGKRAVKMFANKNVKILGAMELEDMDNEPALSEVLGNVLSEGVDRNNDKVADLCEIHQQAKNQVNLWYQIRDLIQLETIVLDGDGDGKGTIVPEEKDRLQGVKLGLKMK
jgi:hypothetical protein